MKQTSSALTAPILNAVSDEYYRKYDIGYCSKIKPCYQLTVSHLNKICENVKKLKAKMGNFDVTFCGNNGAFHITSKRCYQKIVQKSYCNTKA